MPNSRTRNFLILVSVAVLLGSGLIILTDRRKSILPSIANDGSQAKFISTEIPGLSVSNFKQDLGSVFKTSTERAKFVLRNTGTETLEILELKTSCGCTSAFLGEKIIKPDSESALVVTLNTSAILLGNFQKDVFCKGKYGVKEVNFRFSVVGTIRDDVPLRVFPGHLDLSNAATVPSVRHIFVQGSDAVLNSVPRDVTVVLSAMPTDIGTEIRIPGKASTGHIGVKQVNVHFITPKLYTGSGLFGHIQFSTLEGYRWRDVIAFTSDPHPN